jgi:hypothetical protein
MESCRAGIITMDYQPGHPHGFCSAIWMGEIAYCQPLRDPQDLINRLKSIALPYPQPLRDALIRRFQWEILFGIENAELAAARNEQTHIAGCVYRSLACVAQIVFARTSAISSTRRVRYGSSAVTADNSASGRAGDGDLATDRQWRFGDRLRRLASDRPAIEGADAVQRAAAVICYAVLSTEDDVSDGGYLVTGTTKDLLRTW